MWVCLFPTGILMIALFMSLVFFFYQCLLCHFILREYFWWMEPSGHSLCDSDLALLVDRVSPNSTCVVEVDCFEKEHVNQMGGKMNKLNIPGEKSWCQMRYIHNKILPLPCFFLKFTPVCVIVSTAKCFFLTLITFWIHLFHPIMWACDRSVPWQVPRYQADNWNWHPAKINSQAECHNKEAGTSISWQRPANLL